MTTTLKSIEWVERFPFQLKMHYADGKPYVSLPDSPEGRMRQIRQDQDGDGWVATELLDTGRDRVLARGETIEAVVAVLTQAA